MSKFSALAKFTAEHLLHCDNPRLTSGAALPPVLNRETRHFTIHLESAAFVFHITDTTQGITGSLRAACSEPVQRFLACPFS